MTPELISTHDHFLQSGLSAEFILDIRYPKIRNCEEIASVIGERVKGANKGKWIIATGWDEILLEVSVEGLRELEVEATLLAGRAVYSRT